MTATEDYIDAVMATVAGLRDRAEALEAAAALVAECVAAGGVVHVTGCGHSQLAAIDTFGRAGGLAAVAALADPALAATGGGRASRAERLHGYADTLLDGADLRPGEVLVVVSNSGINPVPIELGEGAAKRGLHVIAVTSRSHAEAVPSRHDSGRRLHEVAEVVIDTGTPAGDVTVELDPGVQVGPVSTLLAITALHAVMARASERLVEDGHRPPVLRSQNLPGGAQHNAALLDHYRDRTGWIR